MAATLSSETNAILRDVSFCIAGTCAMKKRVHQSSAKLRQHEMVRDVPIGYGRESFS